MKLNQKFTLIILILVFVPVIVFTMLSFSTIEQNTIKEARKSLEFSLGKSHNEIGKIVDNINMSTQFFLSDKSLIEYLKKIKEKEEISYEEMMSFYNVNISSLERMVNSNPYIYQIRVYVDSDTMEEMMPILYRYERMNRLSWAEDEEISGWKYNYVDTTFDSYVMNQDQSLMALITPLSDYASGQLGVLEVAIQMDIMFPELYGESENIIFFIDEKGMLHCQEESREAISAYLQENTLLTREEQENNEIVIDYLKWQGDPVLVGRQYIKELNGVLVSIDNLQEEIGVVHRNRNVFLFALVLISVALSYFINYVVKNLLSQFYRIIESIRQVQKGDLNIKIEDCGSDEVGELGNQINKMMERIRQLMEDNLTRERLVKNSEIKALQNQINAHFIYNVLESIKMMAEIDEKYDISDAITSLGKLLRYSMRWTSGSVTVGEELEYVKNYLALINLRFDYEIYLSLNMPEAVFHQEIPKMSLQPIVENAIVHGIEQIAEDTNIYVKGMFENGDCIIEITDSGKGMTEQQVEALHRRINGELEADDSGNGNGIGLKNVQDRIKITFGEDYGLTIASKLGCYTKVQMRVPQTYVEIGEQEKQKAEGN